MAGSPASDVSIPSKTLRESVLYVTGLSQREFYGQSYRLKDDVTVADLVVPGRRIDVPLERVGFLTGKQPCKCQQAHGVLPADDMTARDAKVTGDRSCRSI